MIEVQPVTGALGAVIQGVDLAAPLSDRDVAEIRQAFHDYSVIFFRDQRLTPEQHIAFAERFGTVNINRFFAHMPEYPEIAEVRKEPSQESNIGSEWHTDHSYDEIPALGSILLARETPEIGGDTLFASMYKAFEGLSAGLKETLEGMRAVHSSRHVFGIDGALQKTDLKGRVLNADFALQDAVHPVVIGHPDTGRKILYVNPTFTTGFDGWTAEESRPLLQFLYQHAQQPRFTCRFQWRPGSIAFWDNRATWHNAVNDYPGARRLMHRITLEGVRLSRPRELAIR